MASRAIRQDDRPLQGTPHLRMGQRFDKIGCVKLAAKFGIGGAAFTALGAGLYWLLCHCRHRYSRPFTNMPWNRGETYVICLECGAQFDFDPITLKIGARRANQQKTV